MQIQEPFRRLMEPGTDEFLNQFKMHLGCPYISQEGYKLRSGGCTMGPVTSRRHSLDFAYTETVKS